MFWLSRNTFVGSYSRFSATSLPGGLSLNATTGLITGTLSTAADSTVTLTANDGTHSAAQTLDWSVAKLKS